MTKKHTQIFLASNENFLSLVYRLTEEIMLWKENHMNAVLLKDESQKFVTFNNITRKNVYAIAVKFDYIEELESGKTIEEQS